MKSFDIMVNVLFAIKILYLILSVSSTVIYYRNKKEETEFYEKIHTYKEQVEFLFTIGMSLFLIVVFYPHRKQPILLNYEAKFLLFVYGFIVILQSPWVNFFQNATVFSFIKGHRHAVHESSPSTKTPKLSKAQQQQQTSNFARVPMPHF